MVSSHTQKVIIIEESACSRFTHFKDVKADPYFVMSPDQGQPNLGKMEIETKKRR